MRPVDQPEAEGDVSVPFTLSAAFVDYRNDITALRVMMWDIPMDHPDRDRMFREKLRTSNKGKPTIAEPFSQKFSPEKRPGILEAAPPEIVAKLDELAEGINALYAKGELTIAATEEFIAAVESYCPADAF